MAKDIVEKIRDVELQCEQDIMKAKEDAEKMKEEIRISMKNRFDSEIKKVTESCEVKIEDAKNQSKKVIEDAINIGREEKEELVKKVNAKQEKAIKEIIDSLV